MLSSNTLLLNLILLIDVTFSTPTENYTHWPGQPRGRRRRVSKNQSDKIDFKLSTREGYVEEQHQRSTWTLLRSRPGDPDRGGVASHWRRTRTWNGLRLVDRRVNKQPEATFKLTTPYPLYFAKYIIAQKRFIRADPRKSVVKLFVGCRSVRLSGAAGFWQFRLGQEKIVIVQIAIHAARDLGSLRTKSRPPAF
jgi:hypothetical protein